MANSSLPTGDYGAGLAGSAQESGRNAINAFDPTASANTIRGGFNMLANQQTGNVQGFTDKYAQAVANNPNVQSLYDTANTAFGVPQLAERANRLNTQVTNQLPMQTQLMRGFDASQGQIDNATNFNLRFLEPQATAATNASQTAQNLAGQRVQAGITQNQMNLLPIQQQGTMLNDVMARQATGYNIAAPTELDGLINKMNAGVTLSQAEIARANALAQQETSYQNTLAEQRYKNLNTASGTQGLVDVQTGGYYNPFIKASNINQQKLG